MAKTIGIGHQNFEKVRKQNIFYIDKTDFIKEWWEAGDEVTLITRPRRFGKTLTMSMTEKFFSADYAGRSELFEGLSIWQDEKYRQLQGTYPVIFISFADVKETSFDQARKKICWIIKQVYRKFRFLLEGDLLDEDEKNYYSKISVDMEDHEATYALKVLSEFLYRYYEKNVIILLDEYDSPMHEAYMNGYWKEAVTFIKNLFNAVFKSNPYLERAIMTGVTRISKESVFSDLNNLKVVTVTSEKYRSCFGFTEAEVFEVLEEYGLAQKKKEVKSWYDGFNFGSQTDIYNPWSVINYLSTGKLASYWANTSSNRLAGKLIQEGTKNIKQEFEMLMRGEAITAEIDEQIVYDQLLVEKGAVWSLLLASGYLKVNSTEFEEETGRVKYQLALTNKEVRIMFENIIRNWFGEYNDVYNDFIKALLLDDIEAMNKYMQKVTSETFSYFDTGKKPSDEEPERFYHGFVLGLMAELSGRYVLTSNRESGFGRYDVMLEPVRQKDNAIIMEFKVQDIKKEKDLSATVQEALKQIERQDYEAALRAKGIQGERIRRYGFAFQGKKVLIGE